MICFIVNVYNEPEAQVVALLDGLRTHYPLDKIIVLEDGAHEYPGLGDDFHKRFNHRKTPKWGGFWTHRYLDQALRAYPTEHYIKVDPDTAIVKAATKLPDGEAVFSAVYAHDLGPKGKWYVPHGGALGFTYAMARRIVDERLMLSLAFCSSGAYWSHHDLMLADAIKSNHLTLVSRPDFDCGKTRALGPDTTFAHTH